MFRKKNKISNETFGEMEYFVFGWKTTSKFEIVLWGKKYEVQITAVSKTPEEGIDEKQAECFYKFKKAIQVQKNEIETMIMREFSTEDEETSISRFTPTDLIFTRNGECVLYIEDEDEEYGPYDDWDEGFAVGIVPEISVYSKEQYDDYIMGGGSL